MTDAELAELILSALRQSCGKASCYIGTGYDIEAVVIDGCVDLLALAKILNTRVKAYEAALRDIAFIADDGKVSLMSADYVEDHLDKHTILRDVLQKNRARAA